MELQSYIILLIFTVAGNVCGQTCAPNECSEASLPKPMGSGLSGYTPGGSGCYGDGTQVTYICTGSLIGPPTNLCSGGSWFPPVGPTCEAASGCSRPQLPSNGNVTEYGDAYSLYDRITYYCDDGYSIIGPQEAVCDSGGIWSPSNIPTCEASCTAPSIANGGPNGTFVNGEVMTYTCDVNYTLIGVSSATCRDGLWDPVSVPECLGKCLPPIVANSNFATQQNIFDHGGSVIIDCDPGYSTGSSTSTTMTCSDGSLSIEAPTCYENCPPLVSFIDGEVTGDSSPFYHAETVSFSCDPGFTLDGAASITCYDGVWGDAQPMCMGDCPDVVPEAYSAFYGAGSPFQHGEQVTFTCYNGYEIYNGSIISICQNGQWSSDPPFCTEQTTTTQAASTVTDSITTEVPSTRMTTFQDTTLPSTSQTAPHASSTDVPHTSFVTITDVLTEIQTSIITVSTETLPSTDISAVTLTSEISSSEIIPSEQTSSTDVMKVTIASTPGSTDTAPTDMSTHATTSLSEGSTTAQIIVTSQESATDSGSTTLVGGEMTSSHFKTSLIDRSTTAQMIVTSQESATDSGSTTLIGGEMTSSHSTSLSDRSTTAQMIVTSQKNATDSGSTTLIGGEMTSLPEKNVSMSSPTESSSKGITEDQKVVVIVTATAFGAVTLLAIIIALISCHHTRKGPSDKNMYETNGGTTKSAHAYDNNGIVLTHL